MSKKLLFILILILAWLLFIFLFASREAKGSINEDFDSPYLTAVISHLDGIRLIQMLKEERIKSLILSKAKQNDISGELLLQIAKCESGLDPDAKNPTSTAKGIFQFIKSTWEKTIAELERPTMDVFYYRHNIEAAIYLFKKQETQPWLASKECWQSYYDTNDSKNSDQKFE